MYSIGKLAKMSHLTVRTLRYYDEIGLLKPTQVGNNGHRSYDDKALAKLHHIMMLKEMGFELETIHQIIGNEVKSTKELLNIRLEMIKTEKKRLNKMEKRILETLQLMELEGSNDWRGVFDTVTKQYNKPKDYINLWHKHFTPEEVGKLNNLPKVGEDRAEVNRMALLLRDIRENINAAPSSKIAQDLGKRWMDFVHEIYNGDDELAQKAWAVGRKHDIGFYAFEAEIGQFVEAAVAYSYRKKQVGEQQ